MAVDIDDVFLEKVKKQHVIRVSVEQIRSSFIRPIEDGLIKSADKVAVAGMHLKQLYVINLTGSTLYTL